MKQLFRVADAAAQDSFCAKTKCLITVVYDQLEHGNNLIQTPAGGGVGGPDKLANAAAVPTTLGGHKAYGVYVAPGTGYRNHHTSGVATGGLSTFYSGVRPSGGYNPMPQRGRGPVRRLVAPCAKRATPPQN